MARPASRALVRAPAFLLALALAAPAAGLPLGLPSLAPQATTVAADCYAVGQRVAAQNGGTLARATAQNQGDKTVCVIVVLMPAKDGQRPRREEFVVPAG